MSERIPAPEDIRQAVQRISGYVKQTPIHTSRQVDEKTGFEVYFKCENFQRTGSFKFRGAFNAILSLSDEELERGVLTHSSGNHAQAVSLAASIRGVPAHIVMPESAPGNKVDAVKGYGSDITFCASTLEAREASANEIIRKTGATLIHPYNDPNIIAGQGTAALELLEEVPDLDLLRAPVGGGGLLSGTAIAAKGHSRELTVVAAEPEQADDAYRSCHQQRLIRDQSANTIADGLRTSLGELTFSVIRAYVDDVVTVSESSIISEMRYLFERMKLVVEPSSAPPLAALSDREFSRRLRAAGVKKVGIILSGGNANLDSLPW